MGLFGSGRKRGKRRSGGTTIIAAGTRLQGDLLPEGNLHIDGRVDGQIDSANDVSIGAEGRFEGEVRAHRMVVSGFARGRIECDSLEIVDKGQVLGEVASRRFVIEPGGQFVGESRSTDEEALAQLGHWGPHGGAAGSDEPHGAEPTPAADPDPLAGMDEAAGDEPPLTALDPEPAADDLADDGREPEVAIDSGEPERWPEAGGIQERRWR